MPINKNAGIFAALMILSMIIFMTTAWFAFSKTNEKIKESINISVLSDIYKEYDRFSFYLKESSELSASQAFYEIAKDAGINLSLECNTYNNYIIWDVNCKPDSLFIEQKFVDEYNKTFSNYIRNYPNENFIIRFDNKLENKEITSEASSPVILSSEEKSSFATYNVSYKLSPSIKASLESYNIHLEDFGNIYSSIIREKENCRNDEDSVSCLKNNIVLENWQFDARKEGSYYLFKFTTKKYFFFYENEEKFAPISVNVALAV